MASNYTNLGVQLMTTGEKAGQWGTLTNTNWNIIEQISGGYTTQVLPDNGTTALVKNDGTTGATLATRIWKLTGTLSAGNSKLTVPDGIENWWLINNAEGGSTYTVTVSTVSGTGVEWAAGETGYKLLFSDGTNVVDSGFSDTHGDVTLTGTQTLTNKTLTSPKIGTNILDTGGNELMKITVTGSAENEFTMAAGGSGAGPTLSSTGSTDTNIDMNLNPAGSGVLKSGTAAVKIAGTETIFIPAQAMFGTETNGADAQVIETAATRPVMKVLDFDPSTIEYAQFSIAMPKSWNEGTLTFQAFWAPSSTDTGNALIGLQAVSVANDATSDVAFPAAVDVTDAGGGAVEDVLVSPVSANVTVTSAAADTYTYFQVARNATSGSDDFTGDVRLLGIKLFYTTDAANDA